MKKTITNPDGQTETVEGTAEEITAYERAKKTEQPANESPKKTSKKLLLEQIQEMFRQELDRIVFWKDHMLCAGCHVCQPFRPIWVSPPASPPAQPYPGIWSHETYPWIGDFTNPTQQITITTTTDSTKLKS